MRKLIVSNFVTVDGYYAAKDNTIESLFVNGHVKMDTNGHEKSPRLAKK